MRKQLIVFVLIGSILGGCSVIEGVNDSLDYVNEATDYVNEVTIFVEEVPSLAEQAVSDEQALADLEIKLEDMKEEMGTFNELQAPEIAADLHQQIIDYNQKAEEGIDLYLTNIENGTFDPTLLENTEIFQSFQEVTETINQIKELGQ